MANYRFFNAPDFETLVACIWLLMVVCIVIGILFCAMVFEFLDYKSKKKIK